MSNSERCRSGSLVSLLALAAAILVAPGQLTATTYSWWSGGSGNFTNPTYWSPAGGPPVAGDTAIIDAPGAYDIMFSSDVITGNVVVGPGGNEATFTSSSFQWICHATHVGISDALLRVGKAGGPIILDITGNPSSDLLLGNGGLVIITGGSRINCVDGAVGDIISSSAEVVVDGGAWNISDELFVGALGNGTLSINPGGLVESEFGYIAYWNVSTATVDVNGGTWTNSDDLHIGSSGNGTLNINAGGLVQNVGGSIGHYTNSTGAVHVNDGTWTNTEHVYVGLEGEGTLNIHSAGLVENVGGYVGYSADSTGTVEVTGGTWTNSGDLYVGDSGEGTLNIHSAGLVENVGGYVGYAPDSTGTAEVNGGTWTNSGDLSVGRQGDGTLNIGAGGLVENAVGDISYSVDSTGTVNINGGTWTNNNDLRVGRRGQGTMNINAGGLVENKFSIIAGWTDSTGTVNVNGGTWTNTNNLCVGNSGDGTLNIINGGQVTSAGCYVSYAGASTGQAVIDGAGSSLTTSSFMDIGYASSQGGDVTVTNSGLVDVGGTLKLRSGSTLNINGGIVAANGFEDLGGTMNFTAGSLSIANDLELTATGMLGNYEAIDSHKTLTIGGATTIGLGTTLEINGGAFTTGALVNNGAFEFTGGTFALTSDILTVGAGGLMGGVVELAAGMRLDATNGVTVSTGGVLSMVGGTLDGGTLSNSGLVARHGYINADLSNAASGEVRVLSGDSLRFGGAGNSNGGQVNVIGGTVEFTGGLNNSTTGVITGRGTLITGPAGLTNEGNVGLAGSFSDVYGDVSNQETGTIAISGGATTVFWDDVDNLGAINVGLNSSATFFGQVTGNGAGGLGDKYIEGDLKPGSSPGTMTFGGDVYFGPAAGLETELAGASGGEFDVVDVEGQLTCGGTLQIVLISGFAPDVGDTFDILDWGSLADAEFDAIELPGLAGRKVWDASGLYSVGEISVIGMLPGDTDVDWDVDSVDYDNFLAAFGGAGDWHTDFNEDGSVDLGDLAIMRDYFGTVAGSPMGAKSQAAIPEPGTLALMTIGGLTVLKSRRRKK